MALLKCHECSNEVSSEAKTCPKCGAKVKKPTSLVVKILAALFGIGILVSLFARHETSNPSGSTAPQATQTAAAPQAEQPAAAAPQTVQTPAPPKSPWEYSTKKDDMSGKDIAYAETSSLNTEDLHFPYGPGIGATLFLRKHPRSGKDALVRIDKGQILCRSYESCSIMIRFDDRPAAGYSARGPSDGSTEVVFIDNYPKFFAELKRSKRVLVELPLYQDGNRTWKFNVDGLTWQ
jgi:DNA-directed RNA polymerase subunit RPC12/RpoP